MRKPAIRRDRRETPQEEPRMPLRDADLRGAVSREGIRPGDETWRLLVELQERREGKT